VVDRLEDVIPAGKTRREERSSCVYNRSSSEIVVGVFLGKGSEEKIPVIKETWARYVDIELLGPGKGVAIVVVVAIVVIVVVVGGGGRRGGGQGLVEMMMMMTIVGCCID